MTSILEKIPGSNRFKVKDQSLIEKAYAVAERAHRDQKRFSGESYISHPLRVASFLCELGLDATTVAACLLHDTLEDTSLSRGELEKEFGKEIAFLVDGVTKLSKIEYSDSPRQTRPGDQSEHLDSLKKMARDSEP